LKKGKALKDYIAKVGGGEIKFKLSGNLLKIERRVSEKSRG